MTAEPWLHGAWLAFAATGAPGWAPHDPRRPTVEIFGG
jgi:para-nitrobenzyl esterase